MSILVIAGYGGKTFAQDNHGLGLGYVVSSLPGIFVFYDFNPNETSQIHLQVTYASKTRSAFNDEAKTTVERTIALISYRFFFPVKGLYYGFGIGYAESKLKYVNEFLTKEFVYSTESEYNYSAESNGEFLMVEIGWQTDIEFYFHVGIQPAGYIDYSDNFDSSKIPDISNHRTAAEEDWKATKSLTQLVLGIGWHF